jgi:hypothetical protein
MKPLIGKSTTLVTRETIYQAEDGFEVETREHYEISERRVLYDDIQLVTYHKEYGAAYLVVTGAIALLFLTPAIALLAVNSDAWPAAIVFLFLGLPLLFMFLIRLLWRVDVITIFGRRSKARLRFSLRKGKAREAYGKVCAIVRQAHGSGGDAAASAGVDAGAP